MSLPAISLRAALSLVAALIFASQSLAAPKQLTVEAGKFDRQNCVVEFDWGKADKGNYLLRSNEGREFALQLDQGGKASFLLDHLAAGKSLKLKVVSGKKETPAAQAKKAGTTVELTSHGKVVLNYQMADTLPPRPEIKPVYRHNAYLYPILTPAGKLVAGDYPPDHLWHRGVWLAWTHTEFDGHAPDFWNQGKGDKLEAKIDFTKLDGIWSGPVHAGFKGEHQFLDYGSGKPVPALNETWTVRTYALPVSAKLHVFDLVAVQSCSSDKPLKLPEYYYGGLGFRGNRQWEEKGNVSFLLSNGETDRKKANQQRINWIHIGGKTDGELAGITIMDHPDNFRSPQPIRVNPKNPQTCFAVSQLGGWAIDPGRPLTLRYRFVVADGAPDKALLDALWHDYAEPPKVLVE